MQANTDLAGAQTDNTVPKALLFKNVDGAVARMRWQNWLAKARLQSSALAANTGLVLLAVALVLYWQLKFSRLTTPAWLLGFDLHLSVSLVLIALLRIWFRVRQGMASMQCDWLSVQPIPCAQRNQWLRAKVAAQMALELGLYGLFAAGLFGAVYGLCVVAFGACLGLIMLTVLLHSPQPKPRLGGIPNSQQKQAYFAVITHYNQAKPKRASAIGAAPFHAWFDSAIPRVSKLRWWWLLPLLTLPMGSNIVLVAGIFAAFLVLSRFAAVCSALSIALADISKLTQTTPLQPAKLYRAALGFARQGVLLIALVVGATALTPAGLGVAMIVGLAGLMVITSALHFGFGYRLEEKNCTRRSRASFLVALLFGITASSVPFALPVVCALLWLWLYRRGRRLLHPH